MKSSLAADFADGVLGFNLLSDRNRLAITANQLAELGVAAVGRASIREAVLDHDISPALTCGRRIHLRRFVVFQLHDDAVFRDRHRRSCRGAVVRSGMELLAAAAVRGLLFAALRALRGDEFIDDDARALLVEIDQGGIKRQLSSFRHLLRQMLGEHVLNVHREKLPFRRLDLDATRDWSPLEEFLWDSRSRHCPFQEICCARRGLRR
jgi:hypothetical protein